MSGRTLLIAVGAVLLVGLAFAAGAWVGGGVVGSFHGYQVLPRTSVNANMLHRKLLLLDKADFNGLREELNIELDGELLAMCMLVKERAGTTEEAVTRARTVLQRIAKYRGETPPVYPAAYAAQRDERAPKLIQACLEEVAGTSGK